MGDKFANIAGAIVTVALVTTVVTNGSQAGEFVKAVGNAFSSSIRAAMGKS